MRYAKSIAGGVLGTILFVLLVAAMLVVMIERVERAEACAEEGDIVSERFNQADFSPGTQKDMRGAR